MNRSRHGWVRRDGIEDVDSRALIAVILAPYLHHRDPAGSLSNMIPPALSPPSSPPSFGLPPSLQLQLPPRRRSLAAPPPQPRERPRSTVPTPSAAADTAINSSTSRPLQLRPLAYLPAASAIAHPSDGFLPLHPNSHGPYIAGIQALTPAYSTTAACLIRRGYRLPAWVLLFSFVSHELSSGKPPLR